MSESKISENKILGSVKLYARALDPVHIGAGGYRLGRVDNTIVRDPATNIPKIPGTSFAGVVREFYTVDLMENNEECKSKNKVDDKRNCAKSIAKDLFGDDKKKGKLRFYDGQIIFFPVASIQGTVWITTKELLEYWFGDIQDENGEGLNIPKEIKDEVYAIKGFDSIEHLDLGWLFLHVNKDNNQGKQIKLPSESLERWMKKIALVSEKLFSQIVNDNLEVRTSVRIEPTTGTAADGALFTYEAIPRGTILGFEVAQDNYRDANVVLENIIKTVKPYFKLLGIGGMGTRGFGRLEFVSVEAENSESQGGTNNAKS